MTSTPCNPLLWSVSNSSQSPIDFDKNWRPPTDPSTAITARVYSEPLNDSQTSARLSFIIPSSVTKPMSITPFEESLLPGWIFNLSLSPTITKKPPFAKTFKKLGSTMNNLKILRCCYLKVFRNHHLVAIADALPWLEELDIQLSGVRSYYQRGSNSKSAKYIVTDVGIEVISRKLPRLRKIDITGQLG
ncbi:hypothetical protein ACSBR1_043172 [Camellia fascicularis]